MAAAPSPRPGRGQALSANLYRYYPEVRFGGFTEVDGTIAFYLRVHALLSPTAVVLSAGCGRGASEDDPVPFRSDIRNLRGRAREVIGIDVDPGAAANPVVDRFALIENGRWPIESESIDVCVSDWVLEHVDSPEEFFAEARRVLKPGGVFCARTTNRHGYVATAARIIPERWHLRILARSQTNRQPRDVFPTHYRCNTPRALRRYLRVMGTPPVILANEGEPGYMEWSRLAYAAGRVFQRHAPPIVRTNLHVFAERR